MFDVQQLADVCRGKEQYIFLAIYPWEEKQWEVEAASRQGDGVRRGWTPKMAALAGVIGVGGEKYRDEVRCRILIYIRRSRLLSVP